MAAKKKVTKKVTPTKPQENQSDSSLCSLILIKLRYDCQYILPIEEGLNLLRSLSKSRQLVEAYQKPDTISDGPGELTISFISVDDVNEIRVKAALQGNTS